MIGIELGPFVRRVETGTSDRLEYISGDGLVAAIFGLPFLGAGLFLFWLLPFRAIPKLFEVPLTIGDVPLILFFHAMMLFGGVCFTAVGAWCVFGRHRVVCDKPARAVSVRWNILWIGRAKQYKVDGFTGIAVQRGTRGAFGRGRLCYSVVLTATAETVQVVPSGPERAEIGKVASEIAGFLRLKLLANP